MLHSVFATHPLMQACSRMADNHRRSPSAKALFYSGKK